jgi:hypothetical protein
MSEYRVLQSYGTFKFYKIYNRIRENVLVEYVSCSGTVSFNVTRIEGVLNDIEEQPFFPHIYWLVF